mgnify:FL=1
MLNMFDNNTNKSYLVEFDNFLSQLVSLFENNDSTKTEFDIVTDIKNEKDEDKLKRGKLFHSCLEEEDCFDLFLNKKVNSFSSKNEQTNSLSNSLLGEGLPLKKLVNKQTDKTKDIIWNYLHTFYLLNETLMNNDEEGRDPNQKRIESTLEKSADSNEMLKKLSVNESTKKKNVANKLLDIELNSSTTSMIDDIINSFEEKVNSSPDQNPMESIMDITNLIASKYTDKIESGEIQLEDLLDNMKNKLPGLDKIAANFGLDGSAMGKKEVEKEVTIIDDNFSTDNVELGKEDGEKKGGMNLTNGLKMLNSMQSDPQFGKMFEMLNPGGEGGSPEDLINKMKESMPEELLKNFDKEMGNMPDMLSKMMGVSGNNEPDNSNIKELDEIDDKEENSLSLDELKEKFGLEVENDENREVEHLLD